MGGRMLASYGAPAVVVFVPSPPRGSRPLFAVIPFRGVHL
jgi:hypothetical protein